MEIYAIAVLAGIMAGLLHKDLKTKDIFQGGVGVALALMLYAYIGMIFGLVSVHGLLGTSIAAFLPGFLGIAVGPLIALLFSIGMYMAVALVTQAFVKPK